MKAKHIVQFACGLLLIALTNGCVTKALWDGNNLEAWNQPAANPNLRLFETKPPGDVLVVYDEYRERRDASQPRAFWLKENQKLLAEHRVPRFVSTDASNLTSIPIYPTDVNQLNFPTLPYALIATNGQSFTLYLKNGTITTYDLPVYNDGKGKAEKLALTPVTVTADATIVGGILGCLYLAWKYDVPVPYYRQ